MGLKYLIDRADPKLLTAAESLFIKKLSVTTLF